LFGNRFADGAVAYSLADEIQLDVDRPTLP